MKLFFLFAIAVVDLAQGQTEEKCLARNYISEDETLLDNPEDLIYEISEDESSRLLTEMESYGTEELQKAATMENELYAAPAGEAESKLLIPCPSPYASCPWSWRQLVMYRYWGPCGWEYCRPLPWYTTSYAVCRCPTCLKYQGRCVPAGHKLRLLLGYCYHPATGWRIRAYWVKLPTRCDCIRYC